MKITESQSYAGPSSYCRGAAYRFVLDDDARWPARDGADWLITALASLLPGLADDWQACEGVADPASSRDSAGHAFEHVCLALLGQAGLDPVCVRTDDSNHTAPGSAVIPSLEPRLARLAGRVAAALVSDRLSASERDTDDEDEVGRARIEKFVRRADRWLLPVQDRALVAAARARGIPVLPLAGRIVQLGHGRFQQRVSATKTSRTNTVSNDIAANKDYSRRTLAGVGLPVPRYERVYRSRAAVEAADRIGYPVVVKPNNGSMGSGVSVGMGNASEVRRAYRRAREYDRSVLVEEMVEGKDFRIVVMDGVLVAAALRDPAHVEGDGKRTIASLVAALNEDPRRGDGSRQPWTRIELDEEAERLLSSQELTPQSVPDKGDVVYLRRNANTSDGGTAIDVTDDVHPENREIAVRAARTIGLDIAGVDLLTPDITKPMTETGGRICEVNSRPGLRKHIWPSSGKPRDVLSPILDLLFPDGGDGRIPILLVTGDGPVATQVAQAAERQLSADGHCVGLAADGRVWHRGRPAAVAPLEPDAAAEMVLRDPDVTVAVVALSAQDIVRAGLPVDTAGVSLVTSPRAAWGEAEKEAARLLGLHTRGAIIVAGDADALEGIASLEAVDPDQLDAPKTLAALAVRALDPASRPIPSTPLPPTPESTAPG